MSESLLGRARRILPVLSAQIDRLHNAGRPAVRPDRKRYWEHEFERLTQPGSFVVQLADSYRG